MHYAHEASPSTSGTLKCTDLAQFDALQAAAELFRIDDKLHLRNLCNDTSRCAGLMAVHTIRNIPIGTSTSSDGQPNLSGHPTSPPGVSPPPTSMRPRSMILDYSRQRVTGETMELLFDLADKIGLTERREAMRRGLSINTTGKHGE